MHLESFPVEFRFGYEWKWGQIPEGFLPPFWIIFRRFVVDQKTTAEHLFEGFEPVLEAVADNGCE